VIDPSDAAALAQPEAFLLFRAASPRLNGIPMAVEVIMPKFGLTMQDGTIQRYFKAPGESVRAGEPLYEVETEKVLYEVEAPASGTLAAALFPEGATVECGAVIAVIAESGEDAAAISARYGDGAGPRAGTAAAVAAGAPARSSGASA